MNRKKVLILIFALLASCGVWAENGWTVTKSTSGSVTTFTISRTNTAVAETVKYRLVNLSAYAGQHYNVTAVNGQNSNALSGNLSFSAGVGSKTVQVTEQTPGTNAYKYQTSGTERSYKLEVTDLGGFLLAEETRSYTTGTTFSTDKVSKSITNLVYFSGSNYASGLSSSKYLDVTYTPPTGQVETSGTLQGYVLIDDSYDYAQKAATVSTSSLINTTGADTAYLNSMGCKIYATVCFTEKEKDDGYQYIQVIAGTGSASYDTGYDPEGSVNNPVNSVYKVCFELCDGSNAEGKQFFPHRYNYANKTAENNAGISITEFSQTNGKLWQQKFKSGYQATNSGSLIFNADVANITTRFDAGGNNDDTWGYKDLFVRMALVDATAPTMLTVSVAPGKHCKGNTVYVSVAFKEIVVVTGTPTLSTTAANNWGSLSYISGSGTNVLTFSTTIPANASGSLNITGLNGTVKDLAGNSLNGNGVTASGLCSLDASYAYSITYNLADGSVATSNPTTYTWETAAFTLNNPTRAGYPFLGWTGSNGNTPQATVTIANHSHGNKSYTANWRPLWGIASGADGTAEHPYLIATTEDLDTLAALVGRGTSYSNTYFRQTADIAYDGTTPNNFTPVGRTTSNPFGGTYDGGGHTISGIIISSSNNEYGLFGRLSSTATVKNLTFASSTITAHQYVGGIVGYNNGGTVLNCRVESTVTINANASSSNYHGGVVGCNTGTIQGCLCAATVSHNDKSNCSYYGGITGSHGGGTIQDCLFTGPAPTSESLKGSIAGARNNSATLTNNYYTISDLGSVNGSDVLGARKARTVTLGTNISLVGDETAYSNSGLTAIGTSALRLSGGTIYSGYQRYLTLDYTGSIPAGHHAIFTFSYNDGSVSDSTLSGNILSMPDANITVSCTGFAVNSYTVRFNKNGGSGTMDDQSFTGAVAQALTANTFTRNHYLFAGWNTAANGSGTPYSDGEIVTDITTTHGAVVNLYAQWTPDLSLWNADAYHDGTTAERAYIITTTAGLDRLAFLVKDGYSFSGTFFKLGADIAYSHTSDWNNPDINEDNYFAIGSNDHPFSGIFDGCGHTISGIRNNGYNRRGIFCRVSGGTVKNLTVSDTRIRGLDYCGGIVAYNNGTVENCHATATVAVYSHDMGSDYHGGIVGYNASDGIVDGCTSSATVDNNARGICVYYGGVVGGNAGTVRRCFSIDAVVKAYNNQDPVAYNDGGTVTECYYHNCSVNDASQSNFNAIVPGIDVTVAPSGDATFAFPNDGPKFYGSSFFSVGGKLYALPNSTVSLNLTYTGSESSFGGFYTYFGTLSGTVNPYSLTIPSEIADVTIIPFIPKNLPYSYDFETDSEWRYWYYFSGENEIVSGTSHSGSYSLRFQGSTSNVVVLPPFNAATSTLQLSFWSRPGNYTASGCGTFSVGYLTDSTDASSFVALKTYSYSNWTSSEYRRKVVNFAGAPVGSRLAFRHNPTNGSYYWYVDDVEVTVPTCFAPEELAVSNISAGAATFSWLAATGTQWEYAIKANVAANYTPTEADFTGSYTASQSGTQTITISTLSQLTDYTFFLRRACSADSKSEVVLVRFRTSMTPVAVPYADNFESSNGWELENGDFTNQWVWGTAVSNGEGTRSLYISNDGGTTNAYSSDNTTVYAWKTFSLEGGYYSFSYDWRVDGHYYDYLRVALVPDATVLTADEYAPYGFGYYTLPAGWIALDGGRQLHGKSDWQHFATLPTSVAAGTYKMVFVWINNNSNNYNPPASIDNVRIAKCKSFVTAGNWDNPSNWSPAGVPTADDGVVIEADAVVPSGCVALCDQANIAGGSVTVADGGQLVCNSNIEVTVQKNVNAGQWNGISGMYGVDNLSSLTTGTYDLFKYDEKSATWINHKGYDYNLDGKYGYIYRRADNATISLETYNYTADGNVFSCSNSCNYAALKGFNLAGNPCTHDIYFGTGVIVSTGTIAPGFYTLDPDGTWRAHTTADPIHVAQAFLIQTIGGSTLRFYNTNAAPAQSKASAPATLAFTVKGNGHEDVAYAMLNDEGGMMNDEQAAAGNSSLIIHHSSLSKMPHLNAAAPSLSIDGYAIATLDEETKAFPLTLKAQPSEYTLALTSITSGTSGTSYCHLIDKVAGRDIDLLRDSAYTFHANGNDAGRFLVKLSPDGGVESGEWRVENFAYLDGDKLVITGEGLLQMYDAMGRCLLTKDVNSSFIIHHSSFASGVYVLRLGEKTQKIVITK